MKLGHHRRGLGDPGANIWFEREIGADGGPQVLESFDCVEHLTPDADVWWGGGSLPQHLGLLYADCEAKIVTCESKAVDQPLECFFRVRCHGSIVSEEDLPDGNVPDLGFGSEPAWSPARQRRRHRDDGVLCR